MHDRTPIFRSLAMIEERIQEKLTVEALAQGVHFSKYHYQRMFREAVGDSVMGYVTRRKLALAARELAETDCTVLEVALRYGYDSHEGFTRSFKAHMGVTPAEYRKHCLYLRPRKLEKEGNAMTYSKTTDEIIRELNELIVEARETAAYTRRCLGMGPEAAFYRDFWEYAAGREEEMAGRLVKMLEQTGAIARRPDEISARFLMIKAIEDAVFASNITLFQIRLTMARARQEHREAYRPLCAKYEELTRHASVKVGKIAEFFQELASLIFQDMRQNAAQRIEAAVEAGRGAAEKLSDPALPYGYIAEGIMDIAESLAHMPLEELTVSALEDFQLRLETIAFAGQMDVLRAPSHRPLFDGITEFQGRLSDAVEFVRSLEVLRMGAEAKEAPQGREFQKLCSDAAMQESILLFWLKGEIQKMGTLLEERQKAALASACQKIEQAVGLCGNGSAGAGSEEICPLLQSAYKEIVAVAQELGEYGGALAYIAEEVNGPFQRLSAYR